MTDGMSRTLAALLAALVCVAGGTVAFFLAQPTPLPRPPDAEQVVDEVLQRGPGGLGGARLPEGVSALVLRASPRAADPPPPVRTAPSSEPDSDATGAKDEESADPADEDDSADGPDSAPPSAPPDEPAIAPAEWSGRMLLVSDRGQYDAELARLRATSAVVVSQRDGIILAVAAPRQDPPTRIGLAMAGVAALTGALAALAIVVLWSAGRREPAPGPPDEPTGRRGPRPPSPAPVPVDAQVSGHLPDPRALASITPGSDGAHPPLAVETIPPPPPDPVPALRTQRAALIRGLADLAAKLPAEYEWQAANVLDAAGVRRIVPDGDVFDPATHHAVDTVPTPDAQLDDTVARTLRAGWADGNQVVLPARVVVYAGPAPERRADDGAH